MDDDGFQVMPRRNGEGDLPDTIERVRSRTNALGISASAFSSVMTKAFANATIGGKQFDDVLKSMGVKLSNMAVSQAFKPLASGMSKAVTQILNGLFPDLFPSGGGKRPPGEDGGGRCDNCCCQPRQDTGCFFGPVMSTRRNLTQFANALPFAAGGVIGTPSYFPLTGGLGLAGEAGPEAIMPLARGADGRLGVAMNGAGAPANVTVQIATPDAASFRRSEAYITGHIARAVARGQRGF